MEDVRAQTLEDILQTSTNFIPFPECSILDLPNDLTDWVERMLQCGEPLIIRDFNKLGGWNNETLTLDTLKDVMLQRGDCAEGRRLQMGVADAC
jgi:hypothetical protein